jgi:hypothetical protein
MTSRSVSAYRGWEKRRENEERVTVNLPADLLPLWRRTQAMFKGTPDERREQFERYAFEHPREVIEAVDDGAEAWLATHEPPVTPAELASALVSEGAIQVVPGVWSLDPRAVVALAWEAGDGASLAFTFPADDATSDADALEVVVDATWLLDAADASSPDAWAVEVSRDGLSVLCTEGRGFRLCGGSGDVRAAVLLPAALPQPCDCAAE